MDRSSTVVAVVKRRCPHCAAAKPILDDLAADHLGTVHYETVMAEESPDLVGSLRVKGAPTVVAFHDGDEVGRVVGAGGADDYARLFTAAATGRTIEQRRITRTDRVIRLAVGGALSIASAASGNLLLLAIGLFFVVAGLYDLRTRAPGDDPHTVSVSEARVLADSAVLIDVRTKREFDKGAIDGARILDVSVPDFETRLRQLDPQRSYVLYCASGKRSARALQAFTAAGFDDVVHIEGGIEAWARAGLPMQKPAH